MAPRADGWYWKYLSSRRQLSILTRLIPCYVLHLTVRPYRKHFPEASPQSALARLRSRHAAAALDVWVDQLLRAYPSIAGYCARKESGQLAICFMRLLAVFNREYEHRLATGKPLKLEQVLKDPLVASRLAEWEQFASRYTRNHAFIKFMSDDDVIADYNRYVAVTTKAGFNADPALQIESIRLDSGGYLVRLAQLIDCFNERQSEPTVLQEFFHLGMAAKFADDLADLADDYAEERYNLLLALLEQHPAERARVLPRLEHAHPITVGWWQEFAPEAFTAFSRMFESHYQNLQSAESRRICDTTMLRAVRRIRKHPVARARQHVSERPAQPWR